MKIFALSDFHLANSVDKPMNLFGSNWDGHEEKIKKSWNKKVGKNDVGIIAGDLSWAMRMEEVLEDVKFLDQLNGTKIIIKGNHDYWWSTVSKVRSILPPKTFALQNDAIKIDNIIFCGTRGWGVPEPWKKAVPESDQKILEKEYNRLKMSFEAAAKLKTEKKDKIVCIMHYPPFNSKREESVFTKIIDEFKPSAVVYGHLHGNNSRSDFELLRNGIKYYLTSCDLLDFEVVKIKL